MSNDTPLIISLLLTGFGAVLTMLWYMLRRVISQVDTNAKDITKIDVRLAVLKERIDNHEAAHMVSGYRLDRKIRDDPT